MAKRVVKGRKKKSAGKGIGWIVVLFLLVVIALVVWRKWVSPSQIPAEVSLYNVFGIDVSKHSGKIDWKTLKDQKVDFVYIKATEGEDYVDPLFVKNYQEAKNEGLLTGVYHFFRFAKDGKKQAKHFAKTAKIKKGDLLPVIDVEVWGNTLSTRSDAEVIREIGVFLIELERLTGARPMIYTNKEAYRRFINGNYEHYPLWLCDLRDKPDLIAAGWDLWQYSHTGEIAGAPHPIDFNVFRGTKTELQSQFTVR